MRIISRRWVSAHIVLVCSIRSDSFDIAGVNFMEKSVRYQNPQFGTPLTPSSQISIRNTEITFSIWDLGGAFNRQRPLSPAN